MGFQLNVIKLPLKFLYTTSILFMNFASTKFMLEIPMILLPKLGKDPADYSSYRSIALPNLKILIKILATRLAKVNPAPVNINQTGSMPGFSPVYK